MNEGLITGPTQTFCSHCRRSLEKFSFRRHHYVFGEHGYERVCKFCFNAAPEPKIQRILKPQGTPGSGQEHKRKVSIQKKKAAYFNPKGRH